MSNILRTRWAAIGAAVAVSLGAGGLLTANAAISSGDKPVYVSLGSPCRVIDTRPAPDNVGITPGKIGAGEANAITIRIAGANGNCTGALAIPADAVAVSLNLTAINPTTNSNFRVYPSGSPFPTTSNLNFGPGRAPVANKVDVGLSIDGRITLSNAQGAADAAIDVFGYYVDHDHDDRYYTEAEVDAAIDAAVADSVRSDAGIMAYAWSCDESVPGLTDLSSCGGFAFNPSGGAIEAFRSGTGIYRVSFGGLSVDAGSVQVTPYDASGSFVACTVETWFGASVDVRCFDADGNLRDSEFTVLLID